MRTPIATQVWDNFISFSKLFYAGGRGVVDFEPYCVIENDEASILNRVLPARAELTDATEPVADIHGYLKQRRRPFIWYIDEEQKELYRALSARGFRHSAATDWVGMYCREPTAASHRPPDGFVVEQADEPDAIEQWISACVDGYRMWGEVAESTRRALRASLRQKNEAIKVYLGRLEGKPTTTSLFYLEKNVCGLYWVATIPSLQKRGLGSVLLSCGMRSLLKDYKIDLFVLQSTQQGIRLYQKLGFQEASMIKLMLLR